MARVIAPKSTWVWYGYAGHLCVGRRCAYHLCTRVGGFLISTVGDYIPDGSDKMKKIGAGPEAFFETFVFHCDGEDKNGDPIIPSWSEIDSRRYARSIDAERGHRDICDEYSRKLSRGVNRSNTERNNL